MENIVFEGNTFQPLEMNQHYKDLDKDGLVSFHKMRGRYKGFSRMLYTDNTGKTFYTDCKTSDVTTYVSCQMIPKKGYTLYRLLQPTQLFLSTCGNSSFLMKYPKVQS